MQGRDIIQHLLYATLGPVRADGPLVATRPDLPPAYAVNVTHGAAETPRDAQPHSDHWLWCE